MLRCPSLSKFFELHVSNINTRNCGSMIRLPKRKLEYGRISLQFMGAKIFNELPLEIRKQCFDKSFKSSLKGFLKSN